MDITLNQIARALGGEISSGQVLAPGPGHSAKDRSMAVKIGLAGQLVVSSFCGDDRMGCLRYAEGKLGMMWQPDSADGGGNGVAQALGRMHARAIKLNGTGHGTADKLSVVPAPIDGRQQQALRIWQEAVDPRGSIVETYLTSRGLTLPDGAAMSTIRFHADCPFGPGVRHPCMVAALRSIETGAVTAIHRTALSVDGKKIDRKMLGPAAGTAIMLAELDAERGALTIGEGIESALSGLAMGYAPAWAMGSANGIKNLPVLNGVDTLTILGEVDGGANLAACRETGARWRAAQREVFLAMPKPGMGNDANDAWQARQGDDANVLDVREFGEGIGNNDTLEAPAAQIKATPFAFVDPSTIPTRKWLYGRHYIRRFVSATVAPGGVGKSSLGLVEALAMVTAKSLLGVPVAAPLRVWVWNGEDPREELERRIAGVCLHYGLTAQDIGGRLYLDSGRELPIKLVEMAPGGRVVAAVPTIEASSEPFERTASTCSASTPSCHLTACPRTTTWASTGR